MVLITSNALKIGLKMHLERFKMNLDINHDDVLASNDYKLKIESQDG